MTTYRKKPVEVEARQLTSESLDEIRVWVNSNGGRALSHPNGVVELLIRTLEGSMFASENDYVIRGVQGEFYPCKPDIFEQTYEVVS